MKDRKLNQRDYERMEAYAYGFFCGKSGYELDAPWAYDDPDFKYVVQGFMSGHQSYILFDDNFEDYDFDVPEDENGKYVHIGQEKHES